ncbi:penicillin acylase family protein [Beggiatoa leptomitoformis]|uniref:Penicillin acylase family protein n=1 Tax=Beggiatoa leptomitoformis TaxID=288004 RepID=A0A2N9YFV9_9GAMM|nr:penicillin acylase family protein [Beggiatoa leptomitoformis]ALG68303.1 penicillin acylase family protein [Beggiatoa leptomitoformis]AUI69384.1 penicillin acylase family protein [Beggiatoa leptomitoformis]
MLKWIKRLVLGFFSITLLVVIGSYWFLQTTLPTVTGELHFKGLLAPVTISREPSGVVHIQAENETDLFYAQGVAHAQDRLWQMEFQRRIGAGRLAEILGNKAIDQDKFLRTWGFYRAAEQAYLALDSEGKAVINAYVAGINGYLESDPTLPIEFYLLGVKPAKWTPADVLVWSKMMSFNLAGNRRTELRRYALLAKGLTEERIAELMPLYANQVQPADAAPIHPTTRDYQLIEALFKADKFTPVTSEVSNNWVISGQHTASGQPLLANDPHLAISNPSLWYLVHLSAPHYNAIGASLPGLPCVVIGHNQDIAWGVTNVEADVEDIYVLDETADGKGYLYQNVVTPYTIRTETIKVKGEADQSITIKESLYGVVISDLVADVPHTKPLALRWTGHDADDTTFSTYYWINKARDWTDFNAAMRFYIAPSQNFIYADKVGNIGHIVPGRLPIRKTGHSGLYPVAGNGDWDWQGFIPFEALPRTYNPPAGYIATANNDISPPNYPYHISLEWGGEPYRFQRINQLITATDKHDLASVRAIQQDQHSLLYDDFRPYLQNLPVTSPTAQAALKRLLVWRGDMSRHSSEATLFMAWYMGFARLPNAETGESWYFYPRYLLNALKSGDSACATQKRSCLEIAAQVFETVVEQWKTDIPQWGFIHQAEFNHAILTHTPLAPLFDRRVDFGGERFTINTGWVDPDTFKTTHLPSYRQLIDFSQLDNSEYIHTVGQSGNVMSAHFDDLLPLWQKGEYLSMKTTGYVEAEKLVLKP